MGPPVNQPTDIYVISDIHLGGDPGGESEPSFQMCPPANQALLAEFIDSLTTSDSNNECHLVIAGDLVDFLAEKEFQAYTPTQTDALTKFNAIVGRTQIVWDSLSAFVRAGGSLHILLGNHDIELSYPMLRQRLSGLLGQGRVEFLYDNEAFTLGPVLIEHGNRSDAWNAVPHGALRRMRSQMSRGARTDPFDPMPGSRLVVEVINKLKQQYSFVDLLKPEKAGVLPILAALGAGDLSSVWKAAKRFWNKQAVDYDEDYIPTDETYIAAVPDADQELYNLAQDIAAGGDSTQIGDFSLEGLRAKVGETIRGLRRRGLREALLKTESSHLSTFKVEDEKREYLKSATTSLESGFDVVVYGHTHLPKRIDIKEGKRYLNCGTWADLMRVPKAVWGDDPQQADKVLTAFVNDLESDNVQRWRKTVATYAKIELRGSAVQADVYFADSHVKVSDTEMERRFC